MACCCLKTVSPREHIAAVGALEPVDVTGAGDTVIATYSLAIASDASFPGRGAARQLRRRASCDEAGHSFDYG